MIFDMSAIRISLKITTLDYEALMKLRRVQSIHLSGQGLEIKGYYKYTGDERSPGYCLRTASFKL